MYKQRFKNDPDSSKQTRQKKRMTGITRRQDGERNGELEGVGACVWMVVIVVVVMGAVR